MVSRYLALAVLCVACETPPIEVPFSATATLRGCDPAAGPCDPLTSLPEFPGLSEFDVRDNASWRDAGESANRVKSAQLSRLELALVSGAEDFTWLDHLEFLAGGDGDAPVTVAEFVLDDAAKAGSRIVFETTGVDLAKPLRAGLLLVTTRAEGTLPPVDTVVEVEGVLSISFRL